MTTRLGLWSLTSIETGDFGLDGGAMFGVVPKTLWSREHPADESNLIDMRMRALLLRGIVDGQERVVLIDVGAGDKMTPKFQAIYRIDYNRSDLLGSLASAGVTPGQITDVILTHLHFDHCGGSTRLAKGAEIVNEGSAGQEGPESVPTFPNAEYHIQRRQWEWALDPCERDRASYFPENYLPMQSSGQLNLVDGEIELFPDLFLLVVDGHTPGQQLPLIRTTVKSFLYCGDLFPTASHIHMPYIMSYDLEPLKTIEDKKRILPMAVEEKWTFFFEHDAVAECGFVEETDRGFRTGATSTLAECF